jgi:putative transposase
VTGFHFVEDHHQAGYRITDLCRVAGVSRSSFYAWRGRGPSARAVANTELVGEIREIHENSRRTYGAPRVWGQLRRNGRRVGRHRVARLMRTEGLVGAHARRRWRKGRHPAMVPAPDLLEREFTAPAPDRRWVADITEFACLDGKLYLAGIRDLHDRTLVGWSMGQRQTTDLVVAALVMALGRRRPDGELVHHADHGSQYTSVEFTNRLVDWGLVGSYGSVGDCFDCDDAGALFRSA